MGERRGKSIVSEWKLRERKHLENIGVGERKYHSGSSRNRMTPWTGLMQLRTGRGTVSCECGKLTSVSIQHGELLEQLRNCQFSNKNSPPRSQGRTIHNCNIYAVQQDTQSFLMSEFIHQVCLLDMFRTSPVHHQERFTSCICRFDMW